MNIAELFVRRPVLAYMLSAAMLLFGGIGLRDIGIDRMPRVDAPIITISTHYPGASPIVVDNSVTSAIESAVNTVSSIDAIQSTSSPGLSQIQVMFFFSKSADVAFNEVQAKVNQVLNELPREAETPIVAKMEPNALPIAWLILTGDRSLSGLNQLARGMIKKSLENISGVGEVLIGGGRESKMRVDLDLSRMAAFGITPQDVIEAFAREHVQLPGGYLVGGLLEKLIHLDLEFHSATELEELVVLWRDQVPLKLGDIATVTDGLDDQRSLARFNGIEGVLIGVQKIQDANTVAIVDEIEQRLEESILPALPDGVELRLVLNEADIIGATVAALESHILEGTLLAALVVWLFLLNLPATAIVAAAIPVSLAGAVMLVFFGGYTFNVITLSGLLLLIGVVVDDAIVVLESIHRQHETGSRDNITSAIRGTNDVIFPVLAASLTLVCIFATAIFMKGPIGAFMRPFAVVVTVGVAASLFVSLTLTPALCSRFLRAENAEVRGVLGWINGFHRLMENAYRRILDKSLNFRWTVLSSVALMILATGWFFSQLDTEYLPEDDESRFIVNIKAPLGTNIDYMATKVVQAETVLRNYAEVNEILSTVGSTRNAEVNEASLKIRLVTKDKRVDSQKDVIARARRDLAEIPGIEVFINNFPMFSGVREETFEGHITGPDLQRLATLAVEMRQRLQATGSMGNVKLEFSMNRPLLSLDIDRDRAHAQGISTQQIGDTVRVLAGGADIAKYSTLIGDDERYDVRLAADHEQMREFRNLENVYLRSNEGELVRLNSIVDVNETFGPASVERRDLNYSAGFFSSPDVGLGMAIEIFLAEGTQFMPPGYRARLGGQADEMSDTIGYVLFVFVTGLILVYMVLASLFNSFLQPVLVMLAQPLAIIGGVLALWLTGTTLNIFSMIGLVLLVGLVSKNSILLVDLINRYRDSGMATAEAIRTACPRRMRPVLMTSLTIVLAMTPAAVATEAGAGQYGPLAIAVIGGIVSSTLLTLVVVPVAYSLLDRWLVRRSAPAFDLAA